ncbi:ribonuclease H-like domain-containing protein [Tanacetum coccineum]
MRPFGYHVTILNTIDHLGKFEGKADEGFFVGYSTNSKAFRVFNSRTRIVEENLHVKFSEDTPNIAGSGPKWLFDIDALTKSMNYEPDVVGNQSNGSTGKEACDNARKASMKKVPGKDYILLPFLTQDPLFSQSSKYSPDVGFKPSGKEEKKDAKDPGNEDSEVSSTEEPRFNQDKDEHVNSTNNINTVSSPVNAAGIEDNAVNENIVYGCDDDPNMHNLEEIVYLNDDDDVGVEADMMNLDTHILVSPIPTTKIHKDHPFSATEDQSQRFPELSVCLFSITSRTQDPSWIEEMQDELLQFKLQKVWTLVDLPYSKRAIGTKWVYRNKKDERVARIDAIRLFLAYALFKDFVVYQMDVKSAFIYGKIEEEVYVSQPLGFEDLEFLDKKDDGIFISQDKYMDEILKKFGFSTVKIASTPMETSKPLLKDAKAEDVDDSPFDLEAYTDSDYAGASLDRKSTTGGCQFLGRRLISWKYKTVIKKWEDIMERAATTASSLEAEQDSGSGLRCQDAILGVQKLKLGLRLHLNSPMIHLSQELTHMEVGRTA